MNAVNLVAKRSEMDYLDIKNLAQTGEGTFLEFKRTVSSAHKIAREIAAFANTHGGTLLIGVDDDGSLVGVDGYQEEVFLLNEASNVLCNPQVDARLEVVQFGVRDLLVMKVPEAGEKPVYTKENNEETNVYIRKNSSSKRISYERLKLLEHKSSERSVSFTYGKAERKLFRYLNEYGAISVTKFAHLVDENRSTAIDILINLVNAKILKLFTKDKIDYFAFSNKVTDN
ncbi:MAG TPA: ATP-binding protein [Balneolaceae bacterium]|nr:ATP-binding protein [Balneolaceae bacterium]